MSILDVWPRCNIPAEIRTAKTAHLFSYSIFYDCAPRKFSVKLFIMRLPHICGIYTVTYPVYSGGYVDLTAYWTRSRGLKSTHLCRSNAFISLGLEACWPFTGIIWNSHPISTMLAQLTVRHPSYMFYNGTQLRVGVVPWNLNSTRRHMTSDAVLYNSNS